MNFCKICKSPTYNENICDRCETLFIFEPKIQAYRIKKTKLIFGHKRENRLRKILNNIYGKENVFEECCFDWSINPKTGCYLRYDFAVLLKNGDFFLIEFHGEQHFKKVKHFHKNNSDFESQLERDKLKIKFAKKNNIDLVVIKYNEAINELNIRRILRYFSKLK